MTRPPNTDRALSALVPKGSRRRRSSAAVAIIASSVAALCVGILVRSAPLLLTGVAAPLFAGLVATNGIRSRSLIRRARLIVAHSPLVPCEVTAVATPWYGRRRRPMQSAAVRIDAPPDRQGTFVVVALEPESASESHQSLARRLVTPTSDGTFGTGTTPVHATALVSAAGVGVGPIILVSEQFDSFLISVPPVYESERDALRSLSNDSESPAS